MVFSRSGQGSETEQGGRISLPRSDSLEHHAKAVASIQEPFQKNDWNDLKERKESSFKLEMPENDWD